MVRLMLTGYVLIAIAAAFFIGQNVTAYPEGILWDCPYGSAYWFEYDNTESPL
jgi:hypothetical protein